MNDANRHWALIQALILATCLMVNSQAALADIESSTEELKTCVEMHMPDERKKNNPRADRLLEACKTELSAVLAVIPPGAKQEIASFILNDTDEELKK